MTVLLVIVLLLVVLAALGFVAVPLFRKAGSRKARLLLGGALTLLLLGVGIGSYLLVGQPQLALRAAQGLKPNERDPKALIPPLIERVRQYPHDVQAWRFLAMAYMEARDPADAARALAKVIALTGPGNPEVDAQYGEALTMANGGNVTAEAEAAFQNTVKVDPASPAARFYLGLARAQRNDRPGAIQIWQGLLNDTPPTTPLYQMLVDRIAGLTAQAPGAAPDPRRMVAMLAARLQADPNDALGWVRLIRAYAVLGETAKAKEALATAKKTFAGNKDAQTAFDTAAKALKLN